MPTEQEIKKWNEIREVMANMFLWNIREQSEPGLMKREWGSFAKERKEFYQKKFNKLYNNFCK